MLRLADDGRRGLKLAAKSVLAVAYSGRETFARCFVIVRRESPHRSDPDLGRDVLLSAP